MNRIYVASSLGTQSENQQYRWIDNKRNYGRTFGGPATALRPVINL